jgi:hypothetical protein
MNLLGNKFQHGLPFFNEIVDTSLFLDDVSVPSVECFSSKSVELFFFERCAA